MDNHLVVFSNIVKSKLSTDKYLILYCLNTNNKELLTNYVTECNSIDTVIFKQLEQEGYISIKNRPDGLIYYELLSVKEKGKLAFVNTVSPLPAGNFEDFRKFYPSKVSKSGRRLQGNLARCRKLYTELLMETSHDILCKCAKAYHNEKLRSNSEEYMQNLETWLHQRNYQQYLEDLKDLDNAEQVKFTDDI